MLLMLDFIIIACIYYLFVVNNVGVILPYPMNVEEMSEDQVWDMVNINVLAATVLCRMLIKRMKERKRGAIVNVSSMSGMGPTPYMAVYGATKVGFDYNVDDET
jgi:17beta-estradiol 17-dehydrogenase / very-long-chain 3-oxoacyl-CoA reductase